MGMDDLFTEREAVEKLDELAREYPNGSEEGHKEADVILCCLLIRCGYSDAVAAYERVKKWYA